MARIRLDYCGRHLLFRHYLHQDTVRLHAARFCQQHLLCALCAVRRGGKLLEGYFLRFEALRVVKPALRPFLVTVTVRDGIDLAERLAHLRSTWCKLGKRRHLPLKYPETFLAGVEGAVWSFETKLGSRSNLWHPHCHAVVLADFDLEQRQNALREEWKELTADSFMCDVRAIDDPIRGFCEVFKYAVKFSDMSPELTVDAWRVLKGMRLVDSSGGFRGVVVPDVLTDEALSGPYIEYLYEFIRQRGGYDLRERKAGYERPPAVATVPGSGGGVRPQASPGP